MGMSQMCTGAGDYFRTSKPHSEKLCMVTCVVTSKLVCCIMFKMFKDKGTLVWKKVIYQNIDSRENIYFSNFLTK